jgi:hypothetical protein
MLSAPSRTAIYFRKVYNVLACLPLLGFIWVYSFWPTARLFGEYRNGDVRFYWNDPKNVGFPEYYEFLRGFILPAVFLIQLMNLVFLLVGGTLGQGVRTDFTVTNMSRASIALVLGTLVAIPLLFKLDPGRFWFWFFD